MTSVGDSQLTQRWNASLVGSESGRKPQNQIELVVRSTFRSSWNVNDARHPS